jgi:hypothetical protein
MHIINAIKKNILTFVMGVAVCFNAHAITFNLTVEDADIVDGKFIKTIEFTVDKGFIANLEGFVVSGVNEDLTEGYSAATVSSSDGGLTTPDLLIETNDTGYVFTQYFESLNITAGTYTLTFTGIPYSVGGSIAGEYILTTTPVPEASNLGMMLFGLCIIGLTVIRKSSV